MYNFLQTVNLFGMDTSNKKIEIMFNLINKTIITQE